MQLRLSTGLASEEYVVQRGWEQARLDRCPDHPRGGCGFRRHGTYGRVRPAGCRVARWYCPRGRRTFSLLPDALSSRLSGPLEEVEEAVLAVEEAGGLEAAADRVRPRIGLVGAVRWLGRRRRLVRAGLTALIGLLPELLAGFEPTTHSFRANLGVEPVLPALRDVAADHLHVLPPPLGFGPRPVRRWNRRSGLQHEPGPDPPGESR